MENLRFRLHFADGRILTSSQRKEGLSRAWLLLKPNLKTIADLASYIIRTFHLSDSCPNGILLSIDGFVLPQFESTLILKDKDLVCVKRNRVIVGDVVELGEEMPQLGTGNKLLLAKEEFEKEIGGYQSENEEVGMEESSNDTLQGEIRKQESRKRKAKLKLKSRRKKKKRCMVEIPKSVDKEAEKDKVLKKKCVAEMPDSNFKEAMDHQPLEKNIALTRMNNSGSLTGSESSSESTQRKDRDSRPQGNVRCSPDASQQPNDKKKGPSRSSRLKKAKRRFLREKSKLEKKSQFKQNQSMVEKDQKEESSEERSEEAVVKDEGAAVANDQQLDEDDIDDVVPIETRPGHIRFEPLSKDHDVQPTQHTEERFQRNGITSKKKGRKWGTEKGTNRSTNNDKQHDQDTCISVSSKEEIHEKYVLDFEKLEPYVGLPKDGDVIAYRLMVPSASSCPEASSFRKVGKISSYDPDSNVIKLESVPEYPFTIKSSQDEEEDGALQPDTSPGSLEVEFSSIVDPRILKWAVSQASELGTPKTIPAARDGVSSPNTGLTNIQQKTTIGPAENPLDEVTQVLRAKKLELSTKEKGQEKKQERKQEKKQNSGGKRSLSYGPMTPSLVGPTLALLREKKQLEEK